MGEAVKSVRVHCEDMGRGRRGEHRRAATVKLRHEGCGGVIGGIRKGGEHSRQRSRASFGATESIQFPFHV